MREVVLYLDEPAAEAISQAAAFLNERGVEISGRSPLSVAFAGAAQIAAVPVQLRSDWCRVWVTAWGGEVVLRLVDDYVALYQERSRRVEAEVRAIESGVYSEASWPEYEARLRRSLSRADPAVLDARVAALKQRWLALGKRAAAAPEDHLSA